MKKPEIASRMARRSGVTKAEAADQLDRVVHRILWNLKKGQPAPLPGLGKFTLRADGGIDFRRAPRKGGADGKP